MSIFIGGPMSGLSDARAVVMIAVASFSVLNVALAVFNKWALSAEGAGFSFPGSGIALVAGLP